MLLEAKVDQRAELRVGFQNHVAAAATVTPGGTTLWDVFLAPPGHDTVTAAAAGDGDQRLINKLHVAGGSSGLAHAVVAAGLMYVEVHFARRRLGLS